MLDWLDLHTDFGKKRIKDTELHKKAGYREQGSQIVRGFQSEIIATVLKDSADNARGKSGIKISFEEAGSFKYLKDAWVVCQPQVKQGSVIKGYMTAFETGGNKEDSGLESLQDIFDNPNAYDCMAFNNIWEEDLEDTECGLFVPTWAIREEHMKTNGTIDKEAAMKTVKEERRKILSTRDAGLIARKFAENPLTPSEALTRVTTRYFPVEELKQQLRRIQSESLHNLWTNGYFHRGQNKKLKFKYNPEASPVDDYPIKKEDSKKSRFVDLTGCISILQQPIKDNKGEVPKNLYLLAVDPYAQDQADNSVSVGAAYVFKKANSFRPDNYDDNIVAKYIGRPRNTDIFWENVLNLAEYYNTKVQSEILGGGSIGIAYARNNKKLSKLEAQIDINSPRSAKGNTTYFMKTTADMKETGLRYAAEWLKEVRGVNDSSEEVYVYDHIYDIGLLKEMIKYVNDPDKNFDRVSALIVLMHLREQKRTKQVDAKRSDLLNSDKNKKESFWGDGLFEHVSILN